jgi:hypothetical protein
LITSNEEPGSSRDKILNLKQKPVSEPESEPEPEPGI